MDQAFAPDLPEAPLSIHIDCYYKGFHSGITIRSGKNDEVPAHKIKHAIDALIELGFEPSWNRATSNEHLNGETPGADPDPDWIRDVPPKPQTPQTPPTPAAPMTAVPICPLHQTEMNYHQGVNKTTGKPYKFWGCPVKDAAGNFCKETRSA